MSQRSFSAKRRVVNQPGYASFDCQITQNCCTLCLRFLKAFLSGQTVQDPGSGWEWGSFADDGSMKRPFFRHYPSAEVIRRSAASGCVLCMEVVETEDFSEVEPMVFIDPWLDPRRLDQPRERRLPSQGSFLICPLNRAAMMHWEPHYEFLSVKDMDECYRLPIDRSRTIRLPSMQSTSPDNLQQIRRWRKECREHEKCRRESHFLPARLIALINDSEEGMTVRLVKSDDILTLDVQYAALSYCWGGVTFYRTLKENLDAREKNIPLEDLPAVVRDAITVTDLCRLQYLWVDALCICQDDAQEWEREAARMGDVYGGSALTISALCSSTADKSFLKRRLEPMLVGHAEVKTPHKEGTERRMLCLRKRPRKVRQEFYQSPVTKRAWTLQERILAPSVLHFAGDQLVWECNTVRLVSETGEKVDTAEVLFRLSDAASDREPTSNVDLGIWENILRNYSQRALTNASDRLPAIAGLAAKMRSLGYRQGRYAAGLWENELPYELLWSFPPWSGFGDRNGLKEQNLKVPTWSWAHFTGMQTHMQRNGLRSNVRGSPLFSFYDPEDDFRSQDGSAIVTNCAIRLTGFLHNVDPKSFFPENLPVVDWSSDNCVMFKLEKHGTGLNQTPAESNPLWQAAMKQKADDGNLGFGAGSDQVPLSSNPLTHAAWTQNLSGDPNMGSGTGESVQRSGPQLQTHPPSMAPSALPGAQLGYQNSKTQPNPLLQAALDQGIDISSLNLDSTANSPPPLSNPPSQGVQKQDGQQHPGAHGTSWQPNPLLQTAMKRGFDVGSSNLGSDSNTQPTPPSRSPPVARKPLPITGLFGTKLAASSSPPTSGQVSSVNIQTAPMKNQKDPKQRLSNVWQLDCEISPERPCYCLRLMDDPTETQTFQSRVVYLILQEAERPLKPEGPSGLSCQRIGHLILYNMPDEHFVEPYPGISLEENRPLLKNGEWTDIILT